MNKIDAGAAWLSSARVVKCWVNSRNERNPIFKSILIFKKLLMKNKKKDRITSSPHGLY
jgi:hypothetical protein